MIPSCFHSADTLPEVLYMRDEVFTLQHVCPWCAVLDIWLTNINVSTYKLLYLREVQSYKDKVNVELIITYSLQVVPLVSSGSTLPIQAGRPAATYYDYIGDRTTLLFRGCKFARLPLSSQAHLMFNK
jgi:hypothetical protein